MTNTNQNLYHVIKDGKSGFVNKEGRVVIDFEFDNASSFSEGLARIFIDDKVGFIDALGNTVIQPRFESAQGFSNGVAVVTIGDKQGYINKEGELIINPIFYQANDFKNNIALIKKDIFSRGSFIDKQGAIVLTGRHFLVSKYSEGLINCADKGSWGHINLQGDFVIPATYKYTREFSEGKAAVTPKMVKTGSKNEEDFFGFINQYNEIIIPPTFRGSDVRFSENLCAVWNNGFGYIDSNGRLVIPYDFNLGQHFHEGLAVFKPKGKNEKYGYIDKSGKTIIQPKFTSAEDFENGVASVAVGKEYDQYKYGLIDKLGNYIWEPTR